MWPTFRLLLLSVGLAAAAHAQTPMAGDDVAALVSRAMTEGHARGELNGKAAAQIRAAAQRPDLKVLGEATRMNRLPDGCTNVRIDVRAPELIVRPPKDSPMAAGPFHFSMTMPVCTS